MPLICDCCGVKIYKYCIVKYEIDYLEEYLSDYFNRPIDELRVRNLRNKDWVRFRSICFKILDDFAPTRLYKFVSRYGISLTAANSSIASLDEKDVDYIFIKKDLSNNLPETIKELSAKAI